MAYSRINDIKGSAAGRQKSFGISRRFFCGAEKGGGISI